jgi:hypothetical protein
MYRKIKKKKTKKLSKESENFKKNRLEKLS